MSLSSTSQPAARCVNASGGRAPVPRAFTLVELLVVIAIIGVLVALLLPAIQAARESARRTTCANNLKQLGIALTEHCSVKQAYPPGQKVTCTSCDPWAWSAMILPYMEHSEVYNLINFRYQPNDQLLSVPITGKVLPVFLCPSTGGQLDPSRDETNILNNFYAPALSATAGGQKMACNDYAGIEGPNKDAVHADDIMNGLPYLNPATNKPYLSNQGVLLKNNTPGVVSAAQMIKPREIRDGMSATMLLGEMAGRGFDAKFSKKKIAGTWADGFNTANIQMPFTGPPGPPPFGAGKLPENNSKDTTYSDWCPAFASGELIAYHPAGGHVLMCDGSVHFLTRTMDTALLLCLASRNGDETIPIDWEGN